MSATGLGVMARTGAPVEEAAAALAQTRGFSRAEQEAIIVLIRERAIGTAGLDQVQCEVLRRMDARDFEWPEFDRWHTIFAGRGVFPPLWDGLGNRPPAAVALPAWQAYQKRKLYLLIDWLHGLVATRAEMRASLTRYTARRLQAEITRQSLDVRCPVCDPLNHEQVQLTSRNLPPFHPGCRCLILASTKRAPTPRRKPSAA